MAELSPLRRRMIEDMTIRNLSPATQRSYVHAVAKFSRYFGRSPDRLGLEDVRAFQVHLVSTGISWPALNQTVCALRFFYGVTLGHAEIPERIVYVSAGLARLSPDFEQVASSLGARPAYRLWHVTLPLLAPYLVAAFGLSFALSMGELGATVMVYPPGWVTLPVSIFSLTDRGDIFAGAALTMILVAATLILLLGLERITARATGS